jgi:hypothetical protein
MGVFIEAHRKRVKRPKMTADEARHFDTFSAANILAATNQLVGRGVCDGSCEGYSDIFTFNRWRAQGLIVQKGQNGAKITVFIPTDDEDRKIPRQITVFCRHQVGPLDEKPTNGKPTELDREASKLAEVMLEQIDQQKPTDDEIVRESVTMSIPADKADKVAAILHLL